MSSFCLEKDVPASWLNVTLYFRFLGTKVKMLRHLFHHATPAIWKWHSCWLASFKQLIYWTEVVDLQSVGQLVPHSKKVGVQFQAWGPMCASPCGCVGSLHVLPLALELQIDHRCCCPHLSLRGSVMSRASLCCRPMTAWEGLQQSPTTLSSGGWRDWRWMDGSSSRNIACIFPIF